MLGPSGVIPKEFPNVSCFNVDLPGPRAVEDPPDDVIAEFWPSSRNPTKVR